MHDLVKHVEDIAQLEQVSKNLDEQTTLVVSMRVGDPRIPAARHLLDEMHESAAKQREKADIIQK